MKKQPIRVIVHLLDSRNFIGYIYLDKDQRLQDLLNDSRVFIPIQVVTECDDSTSMSDISFKTVLMQKCCIASIEDGSLDNI